MRVQAIGTPIMHNALLNLDIFFLYIFTYLFFYKNKWGIVGYFYKKYHIYFNTHLFELMKSITSKCQIR